MMGLIIPALLALAVITLLFMTVRIVPQRQIYVVERLGKYRTSLEAGLHILMPFIDRVAYRHSLKEIVRDVPRQSCITKDNIEVSVDGVMYLQRRPRAAPATTAPAWWAGVPPWRRTSSTVSARCATGAPAGRRNRTSL